MENKEHLQAPENASGNPANGTLYVQKSVFGDKEPKKGGLQWSGNRMKIGKIFENMGEGLKG